ncbi:MAG TPA: response regulator [Candidatus Limnocylindria bacterium]|nr:response regulator [Candidatus Limnocylindria bacterium]
MTHAASSTSVHRHVAIVVDDDVNVRRLFQDALDAAGVDALVTASGEEALRLASTHPDTCVVLADVRMPQMDGWDVEREMRRMAPELPVVLVTADRLLSIRGSVRDKPVSADEIEALVRTSCTRLGRDRPD